MHMPDTLRLRNGQKAVATFSAHEYARRHAQVRALMSAQQLEALVLTSYHNVNYYRDYLYCAFGRAYAVVITPDQVVLISANIVYTDWRQGSFFTALRQALPRAGRIGVQRHLPISGKRAVIARLPGGAARTAEHRTVGCTLWKSALPSRSRRPARRRQLVLEQALELAHGDAVQVGQLARRQRLLKVGFHDCNDLAEPRLRSAQQGP